MKLFLTTCKVILTKIENRANIINDLNFCNYATVWWQPYFRKWFIRNVEFLSVVTVNKCFVNCRAVNLVNRLSVICFLSYKLGGREMIKSSVCVGVWECICACMAGWMLIITFNFLQLLDCHLCYLGFVTPAHNKPVAWCTYWLCPDIRP